MTTAGSHVLRGEIVKSLRAKHVGQYGAHGAAKRAGFRKNDILVAFDGRKDLRSEQSLFRYALDTKRPGEKVDVVVRRGETEKSFQLPIQK